MASYTDYTAHQNQTITVTNTDELNAAIETLRASSGGTVTVDGSYGPYQLDARDAQVGPEKAVLVKSVDPSTPAVLEQVTILNTAYITLTELKVFSGAWGVERSDHLQDIRITDSDRIELVNMELTSTASGLLGADPDAVEGEDAIYVFQSSNILIAGNVISKCVHAIGLAGVMGVTVSENEFFELQGDGIRGGGVENAVITNNHFRDFLGTTNDVLHTDMIQLWVGYPDGMVNKNIEISYNILDSGVGGEAD